MRTCFILTVILLLAACQPTPSKIYKKTLLVFGTLTDIALYQTTAQQAQKTFSQIEGYFQKMHHQWHAWQGNGMLMQINRHIATGKKIHIDPETAKLLLLAKQINQKSNGYFDPGIGKLIALWGFHKSARQWHYPDQKKLQQLFNSHASIANITISNNLLSSSNKQVSIDLGGIAKGYLAQQALHIAQKNGIDNAIINTGGDVCVSGSAPGRAWNIAIRHPDKKHILASVQLQSGECLMTSGGYERYHTYQGKRLSHIINPKTGLPVVELASVSVIDKNGALADAAATALSIALPEERKKIARKLQIQGSIILLKHNKLSISPAIANRVEVIYAP